jgi:hypothetical protein
MSYYRIAEMAVALSFGLTFALVGWWEIVRDIWSLSWVKSCGVSAPPSPCRHVFVKRNTNGAF